MSQRPSIDMLWGVGDLDHLDELDNQFTNILPVNFDQDIFHWENIKLEDAEALVHNSGNLEIPTMINIFEQDEQADNIPSPSSTDCGDESDVPTGRKTDVLLDLYDLDDDKLGDITLKKLKSLCHSPSDFNILKLYRRTCLNRHYARSSRTKQQNKTSSLATMLEQSQQDVTRLQQDNDMKDATIRCLQLELEIMRSLNQ